MKTGSQCTVGSRKHLIDPGSRLARFFLLFIMVATVDPIAGAPLVWRWSNPRPHGNNIADMAFRDGWVVQVAERGQVYVSKDLDQWIPRDSGTTKDLRGVTFFGGKVIATGESGTVLLADALGLNHPFRRIDLGTDDWLESVSASSTVAVAVGDNGAIYTSPNGTDWQRRPQDFTSWLRSVVFGNGMFVAVGEGGFVASSTDGVIWQRQNSGVTESLNRVLWLQNRFVAAGDSGRVITSPDGRVWQTVATGAANSLYCVTANANTLVVAGEEEVRLQENGVWSDEIRSANRPFPAPTWTYLSSLWDDRLYLLAGRSGLIVEGFKTNATGVTHWVDRYDALRNWIWDLSRTSDFYIAVGDRATVMTSEDGIDWNVELVPESLANAIFLGVGGTSNLFFAVGNKGAAMISANGVIWNAVTMPTSNDLQGVAAWSNQLVVAGGGGTILTSPNGTNWTARSSGTTAFLSSVAAFPSGFVAVGNTGAIVQSPDGVSWTPRQSGTAQWIYRVRFVGDQLIAVGQNGTILTSPNGANWTARSSGTTNWLTDAARVGPNIFVSGTQGTMLRSADAIQWEDIGTITRKSLFALAQDGTQLIAAGVEGAILRSWTTPDLTPITIKSFARKSGENAFLFLGKPDQRFTLDSTANLPGWLSGPELEFLDSSGTLIHLDSSSGATDRQFFRATLR